MDASEANRASVVGDFKIHGRFYRRSVCTVAAFRPTAEGCALPLIFWIDRAREARESTVSSTYSRIQRENEPTGSGQYHHGKQHDLRIAACRAVPPYYVERRNGRQRRPIPRAASRKAGGAPACAGLVRTKRRLDELGVARNGSRPSYLGGREAPPFAGSERALRTPRLLTMQSAGFVGRDAGEAHPRPRDGGMIPSTYTLAARCQRTGSVNDEELAAFQAKTSAELRVLGGEECRTGHV
ncbi:uncharacterized protein C8Q71DRAFT_407337 [Rhodofomes roseus]|uniref:Uncharacterized protein n=1 Tax=Rhodofomes roseus TaxID=34475 RepID=A0ABQ8JZ35_9APHY|nr:uncharacterized protein C8Q71DRAFT_407337 [Rhodofomes roseus]KAH9829500.1 hypothetical protein C8Q71DRAFT_407337 [Rhodofomes roseus]